MRICPLPVIWEKIGKELEDVRSQKLHEGRLLPPVPVPLILAGWAYTNDIEKMDRWNSMKDWACDAGVQSMVETISEDGWYETEVPSAYDIGPMGGPMYQSWNSIPSRGVSAEDKMFWLSLLLSNWSEVAGPVLNMITRPGHITGTKGRRLLVFVIDPCSSPPWGQWDRLPKDSRRSSFRDFRARINSVLKPHMVDHVDFEILDNERGNPECL